ncbi:MAG: M48 family metalloprotease [Candidatus Synoicihabitans palmerolidicus]|nr:M48 family metalloprotease [Candidatus Synoicihabitans palmerolidicus]
MKAGGRYSLPFAAMLMLVGAGCSSTSIPPMRSATEVIPDEPQLLRQAALEESRILRSGFVVELPEVEAYLQQIVLRLAGSETSLADTLRVRIVQDPTLNAFALPNGALFVHTGLLARLENEAQIATILAH